MTQEEFSKRYEFNIKTDIIGGGSFGTVYKAYDTVLDREVAIKVSEVKTVGNKEFSLREEFKAIESVPVNKFIANYETVYRFEFFNGIFDYAIMQYYSLGNLSNYLKNNQVSLKKRESITKGILEGISFLHKYKVVHRDLKPSNILVVNRKGEIIPKITDFGLSKQAKEDGKASRFTNSFAGGTLQYSSPEQLKGLPLKLNTDLWSFGAIAYEILTTKTLFSADKLTTASAEWQNEITQKILHATVNEEIQNLPLNWQKVVSFCLERDVSKRVQSTSVLFSLLEGNYKEASSGYKENPNTSKNNKGSNIRIKISLTPEEIKNGIDKIVKIRRKVKEKGKYTEGIKIIEETITIPITKGIKEGDYITIKGKGYDNILEKDAIAGDLIVVIGKIKTAKKNNEERSNLNATTKVKEKNNDNSIFKTSIKDNKSKGKATKLEEKNTDKTKKTKSKEYYFRSNNRMFFAKLLSFIFVIILFFVAKHLFFSASEPTFNEMQPISENELELDLEYILDNIYYLLFIKVYILCFMGFLIKNLSLISKVLIAVSLIIATFLLFLFSAIVFGSLIGIPFLLLLLFFIYNLVYWIQFWLGYRKFKISNLF